MSPWGGRLQAFEATHVDVPQRSCAALASQAIGVTNLIFPFAGWWLIDRLGRRTLLFTGSFRLNRIAWVDGISGLEFLMVVTAK
jgi:hypothetical protein